MAWNYNCKQKEKRMSRNVIIMDGRMATTLHLLWLLLWWDNSNCLFYIPGSVYDSQVAGFGNIYNKMVGVYLLSGVKCCIDSAFGNMARGYLYKLFQEHLGSDALSRELRKVDLWKKREATLARQTAEWGMRMLHTLFPQVKDRFVYKERGDLRIHPNIIRSSTMTLTTLILCQLSWNVWFMDYQYVFYLEKVIFHLGKVYFNLISPSI